MVHFVHLSYTICIEFECLVSLDITELDEFNPLYCRSISRIPSFTWFAILYMWETWMASRSTQFSYSNSPFHIYFSFLMLWLMIKIFYWVGKRCKFICRLRFRWWFKPKNKYDMEQFLLFLYTSLTFELCHP